MGRIRNDFIHNSANFTELVHQVNFIVKASGCIDQNHPPSVASTRLSCGISNGCRIGVHSFFNELCTRTLSPNAQLINGSSSKGISSTENNGMTLTTEFFCQLTYGSCFPYAIDTDNEHNPWLSRWNLYGLYTDPRRKLISQLFAN